MAADYRLPEEIAACLPETGPLRTYIDYALTTTDAEPLFHLATILPTFAFYANQHGFHPEGDHSFRVFTFIIGQPASSKTTAMRRAKQFFEGVAIDHITRAKQFPGMAMQFSQPQLGFVQASGTIPGIYDAINEHIDPDHQRVAVILHHDEISQLLKKHGDDVAEFLCQLSDGSDIENHLRGRKRLKKTGAHIIEMVEKPASNAIFATTFRGLITSFSIVYLEGGLYTRFLWFVGGEGALDHRLEWGRNEAMELEARAEWLQWAHWADMPRDREDKVVHMPNHIRDMLRSTLFEDLRGSDPVMAPTLKRALERAQTVAKLYALQSQRTVVNDEDMARAINLVEFSVKGLRRLVPRLVGDPILGEKTNLAFNILQRAGKKGLSRSQLYKALHHPSRHIFEQVVTTLLDEGSIAMRTVKRKVRGRPPHQFWALVHERGGEINIEIAKSLPNP